jgi:hypothetical protein
LIDFRFSAGRISHLRANCRNICPSQVDSVVSSNQPSLQSLPFNKQTVRNSPRECANFSRRNLLLSRYPPVPIEREDVRDKQLLTPIAKQRDCNPRDLMDLSVRVCISETSLNSTFRKLSFAESTLWLQSHFTQNILHIKISIQFGAAEISIECDPQINKILILRISKMNQEGKLTLWKWITSSCWWSPRSNRLNHKRSNWTAFREDSILEIVHKLWRRVTKAQSTHQIRCEVGNLNVLNWQQVPPIRILQYGSKFSI